MKLRLVKLKDYSGDKASFYTVLDEERNQNPFSEFFKKWSPEYDVKLINLIARIKSMANHTSAIETFFKLHEGLEYDDLVSAIYDEPEIEMRLYCIRMNDKIVILGGGGPKKVRAWQDDLINLKPAVEYMMLISEIVRRKLKQDSLYYSDDGLTFKGDLFLINN